MFGGGRRAGSSRLSPGSPRARPCTARLYPLLRARWPVAVREVTLTGLTGGGQVREPSSDGADGPSALWEPDGPGPAGGVSSAVTALETFEIHNSQLVRICRI